MMYLLMERKKKDFSVGFNALALPASWSYDACGQNNQIYVIHQYQYQLNIYLSKYGCIPNNTSFIYS